MKVSAAEKLRRFYQCFSGTDEVLVVINADPDAIASAMAVKRLLWRKVAGVRFCNINVIKRPDNLAMIRLLGVQMTHVDEIAPEAFTRFVMVDSQPDHHPSFSAFAPEVIIDHHPRTEVKARFADIRPEYGATASILTEYIKAAGIKPSSRLATALFHAIKTDTSNFERKALLEDIRAFQFLFRHANIYLARKIERADLRLDFLKYFQLALQELCLRKNRAFVHLGEVSTPDICVLIADFYMRIHSVHWSIAAGFYQDALIIVFRNHGLGKSAGKVAKDGFGQYGSAGGHKSMARAELPLDRLDPVVDRKDKKALLSWIIERVEKQHRRCKTAFNKENLGIQS